MKREELQELGLESSQINAVMGMHGSVVNDLNDQVRTLEKESEQLKEQNQSYADEVESLKENSSDDELKAKLDDLEKQQKSLQQEHQQELHDLNRKHKIQLAVKSLGVKDEEYVADKLSDLELKDGELVNFEERTNELKEKHPLLFEDDEPKQAKKWSQGGTSTINQSPMSISEIMQVKDPNERQKLIAENRDKF